MTPELQNLMAQAEAAQRHAQFLGYSTYAAIIVCAIFSVLIFWKLCQIQKQLLNISPTQRSVSSSPAKTVTTEATSPPNPQSPAQNDSRYMPKG